MRGQREPRRARHAVLGALAVTLIAAGCTGGDDDEAVDAVPSSTTTTAPTTTTVPAIDLDALTGSALADLAGCDGIATEQGRLRADLIPEEPGEETVLHLSCTGDEQRRVLVLTGRTTAAALAVEPIVASDPEPIGESPVRLLAYQVVDDRVIQTVYRWDGESMRAMSETLIPYDDYLAAIGTPVEVVEPLSRADVVDLASPAVARLSGNFCDGFSIEAGTGFLVAPDLVVTAAHVVEGHGALTVELIDGTSRAGETVGFAPGQDAALVQLETPVEVEPLAWSDRRPRVGFDITVLGYPLGLDLSVTSGTISGVGRTILFPNNEQIPNVLQTDALTNPGNSGGPWLDETGRVIGLHIAGRDGAAGINWGVDADVVRALVDQWMIEPQRYQPCAPPDTFAVEVAADHSEAAAIEELFVEYAGGISTGDYELAYGRLHEPSPSLTEWSAELATSVWTDVVVTAIGDAPPERIDEYDLADATTLQVEVSARTTQAPRFGPDGQECTDWALVYLLVQVGGRWEIVSSGGSVPSPCG